jgi:hypothetical protein
MQSEADLIILASIAPGWKHVPFPHSRSISTSRRDASRPVNARGFLDVAVLS